jgi:hypothetical protein
VAPWRSRFRHSRSTDSLTHRPGDPALPPATYLYWWLRGCPRMKYRFAVGDGFVVVVDEWETDGHFEKFFADPDL